jgi:hypothetical protein
VGMAEGRGDLRRCTEGSTACHAGQPWCCFERGVGCK